jgi:hypothetical protein
MSASEILFVAMCMIAVGLWYAGSCWIFPFARCPRCSGTGKCARSDGKVWRACRRCKGTGRRLRIGRRIYNAVSSKAEAAK